MDLLGHFSLAIVQEEYASVVSLPAAFNARLPVQAVRKTPMATLRSWGPLPTDRNFQQIRPPRKHRHAISVKVVRKQQ